MKDTFQKLHHEIDSLLTQPHPKAEDPASHAGASFENEENFSRLDIPDFECLEDRNDKVILLFSRLSVCYEYGLLLEQQEKNLFTLSLGFDHGQIFSFDHTSNHLGSSPLSSATASVNATTSTTTTQFRGIPLPKGHHLKVQKLKNLEWFKKWNLGGLAHTKDFTHLLFRPWPSIAMILSSHLADPWLKLQIEKTLVYLNKHDIEL